MLGLFLFLQAASALPALHHWLHSDSTTPDHQCVIRLVSQGQIEHALPQVAVPLPQIIPVPAAAVPAALVLVEVDYRLLPGRAPPSVLT
jgi:hypothetical protein